MAVEAVNGVDQQQRTQHSVGAAIGTGVVGGGLGYLGGYLATNKRPDLDKVFAMPNDKFEAATKDAEGEVKTAADTIADARKQVAKVKNDARTAYSQAITIEPLAADAEAVTTFNAKKDAYLNKILEKINEGKEESAKVTDIKNATKADVAKAKRALKDSTEATEYREAKVALRKAKTTSLRSSEDATTKSIVEGFDKAGEKATEKMNELKGKEEIKQAFEKIQSLFKKEHSAKTAWIAAAAAAAVGLIAGYMLSGKPAEAPQETQA